MASKDGTYPPLKSVKGGVYLTGPSSWDSEYVVDASLFQCFDDKLVCARAILFAPSQDISMVSMLYPW